MQIEENVEAQLQAEELGRCKAQPASNSVVSLGKRANGKFSYRHIT